MEPLDPTADHVVRLSGDVDAATRDEVRAALDAGVAAGAPTLVVDLSAVTFFDSTGLGAVGRALGELRSQGRTLVLRGAPANVRRVLETAGFQELIEDATQRSR